MGITITAKNPRFSFELGGSGFFNLRKNIAFSLDKEFGENYAKLIYCHSKEDYENHDKTANQIIQDKHLDENYTAVLDFLYASDETGKINYKTCKQIYDLIAPINFKNKSFRYGAYSHNDYEEFKIFLLDCYSHHKNMIWY